MSIQPFLRCGRHLLILLLLFFVQTPLNAQPSSWPVTLTDATGKRVSIARPPSRIISLIPSNTEILFALGLGNAIVGVTDYCDYPPEAKQKPSIGDLMTFSAERIIALKPDLVLATKDNPDEIIHGLTTLGVPVFVLDPQTVYGVFDAITTVGQLTGRRAVADTLVQGMRARLDGVTGKIERMPGERRPTVFMGSPRNAAHWTPGPITFTTDIITLSGGRNIADDLKPGTWGVYSLERIVSKNPEVIISTADSEKDIESVRTGIIETAGRLAGWKELQAIRNRRVYVLPANWIMRPGPRVVLGVERLARDLYPEVFMEK